MNVRRYKSSKSEAQLAEFHNTPSRRTAAKRLRQAIEQCKDVGYMVIASDWNYIALVDPAEYEQAIDVDQDSGYSEFGAITVKI